MFDVRTFDEITAGADHDGLGPTVTSLPGNVGGTSSGSLACLRASTSRGALPGLDHGVTGATGAARERGAAPQQRGPRP